MVEALCTADAAYGVIADIHQLAVNGRQKDALHLLGFLAEGAAAHRPILRGVIAAQRQAAEAHDLMQRPNVRVIASIGVAQPKPDAANSEAQSPSPNPSQPAA